MFGFHTNALSGTTTVVDENVVTFQCYEKNFIYFHLEFDIGKPRVK